MCLLVVCSQVVPGFPLVVAANRDERLDRPATSMTVLQEHSPRILGGRDEQAGGTWLAVNDHGVVAGLTNQPSPGGRDPSRRSRGELPRLLATEPSAHEAVISFAAKVVPSEYNPARLLVGDRRSLYYLEVDGIDASVPRTLLPGTHILENRPIDAASGKVERARELVGDLSTLSEEHLIRRLIDVLSDHELGRDSNGSPDGSGSLNRPACVHGERYGTRSSTIALVPAGTRPIVLLVADGRPCSTPFTDETGRWSTSTE